MRLTTKLEEGRGLFLSALAFGLVLGVVVLQAQTDLGTVKNFTLPEYYDPPHESQLKSLLHGAVAVPQPGGKILIKELRLETFGENGEPGVIVEAKECVYDNASRTASSPTLLRMHSADGRIFLEGEGFLWRQTNSNLTISNRVRTIILDAPKQTPKP